MWRRIERFENYVDEALNALTANRKLITISNERRPIYGGLEKKKFKLTPGSWETIDRITHYCVQIRIPEDLLVLTTGFPLSIVSLSA